MSPEDNQIPDVKDLLKQNTEVLEQNNKLLKKLYRYQVWGIWFSILWYAVIIISPFALYFYVFAPYMEAWNASYGSIFESFKQVPGLGKFLEEYGNALEKYK